jgi:hypothetical protein
MSKFSIFFVLLPARCLNADTFRLDIESSADFFANGFPAEW